MNIIVGIYYNDGKDIQRNQIIPSDNYDYFKNWHESAKKLGIKCILLTDGSCSEDFIQRYNSDHLEIKVTENKQKENHNTVKFLDIKKLIDEQSSKYKKILITDTSDVIFLRNPFDYISTNSLYVGSEQNHKKGTIYKCSEMKWAKLVYGSTMPEFPFWEENFLNCGIVGGNAEVVKKFLEHYKEIHSKRSWPEHYPNDMIITTLVAYRYFKNNIVTGAPLHTIFKKYENNHPEAYIVHK